jgi:hypothetical protein
MQWIVDTCPDMSGRHAVAGLVQDVDCVRQRLAHELEALLRQEGGEQCDQNVLFFKFYNY